MTTSGTVAFSPSNSDITLTAFRRVGIRASAITNEHMVSARMAVNLVQSTWANMGVNLWRVDLQTIPLVQGVTTYNVPADTVMVLDAYIRLFSMGSPVNQAPNFSTVINTPTVTVNLPANGLSVSNYLNIVIPVSVGGLILYGFYQVVSVLDSNNFTITAASNATSTVNNSGAVPVFTTAANSQVVNVHLANHGQLSGQSFVVQVATTLGGITLFGSYTITSIVDANNFTLNAAYQASSIATLAENSGNAQLVGQNTSADPVDRVMNPISRTDYSALPDKFQQGFPTIMWFDRLLQPTLTLWQVPDGNGPYALLYYRVSQIQDAAQTMGQTPDIPYRFLEAMTADLAWFLAKEWNPAIEAQRKADADMARALAMAEDRERVPLYLDPDFSGYFT
jgi:hypothetical protein